jgi:hypothetical protein
MRGPGPHRRPPASVRRDQPTGTQGYLGALVLPCPRPLPELPGPSAELALTDGDGVARAAEEAGAEGVPSGPGCRPVGVRRRRGRRGRRAGGGGRRVRDVTRPGGGRRGAVPLVPRRLRGGARQGQHRDQTHHRHRPDGSGGHDHPARAPTTPATATPAAGGPSPGGPAGGIRTGRLPVTGSGGGRLQPGEFGRRVVLVLPAVRHRRVRVLLVRRRRRRRGLRLVDVRRPGLVLDWPRHGDGL